MVESKTSLMTTAGDTHATDLAIRAAQDRAAFVELYQLYFDSIYRFVYFRVGNREDAEEVTSDVFRKVHANLSTFDPSKASFKTWIYRIASNAVIDLYRKQRKKTEHVHVSLDEAAEVAAPHDILGDLLTEEQRQYVHTLLRRLSEKDQQILHYRYFDELGYDEIAERMEMSVTAVTVAAFRSLKKLKALIGESRI